MKYDAVKRAFDITAGGIGLILTAPLQAAVAVAVWKFHGRPVLFRQPRPGKGGAVFELLKFRTMLEVDEAHQSDAERLTSFGRLMRSLSLDELPTLWNVFKGDMSLVGPRPLLVEYLSRYTPEQARRLEVRPGVTGLAQVSGRNSQSWEERFVWDVRYVDHMSLRLDLEILLRTVKVVLSREGVSAEGHATMPIFMGGSEL